MLKRSIAILNISLVLAAGAAAAADSSARITSYNVCYTKLLRDPIAGGDIVQYVLTITNGGNSTAYDVNVTDILPSALAFYGGFVPTATIDSSPVSGFVATPDGSYNFV